MQHCLARHAAQEAARAKILAHTTALGAACAWGVKGAQSELNQFMLEMDAIIQKASGEPVTDVFALEVAAYEHLESFYR